MKCLNTPRTAVKVTRPNPDMGDGAIVPLSPGCEHRNHPDAVVRFRARFGDGPGGVRGRPFAGRDFRGRPTPTRYMPPAVEAGDMYVTLQAVLPAIFATPLGKLLVALVVLALIVVIGKFVLNVAARLLKIAVVVVLLLWLLVSAPDLLAGLGI